MKLSRLANPMATTLLSLGTLLMAQPAAAVMVTETYSFYGTSFGGSVGPSDLTSVSGQFTVTYDPSVSNSNIGPVDAFTIDTVHPSFNPSMINVAHFNSGGYRSLQIGGAGSSANPYQPNDPGHIYYLDADFGISLNFLPSGAISPYGFSVSYSSMYPTPHGIYTSGFNTGSAALIANPPSPGGGNSGGGSTPGGGGSTGGGTGGGGGSGGGGTGLGGGGGGGTGGGTGGGAGAVSGAVPEPATWATMVLGFLLVGAPLRRSARLRLDRRTA